MKKRRLLFILISLCYFNATIAQQTNTAAHTWMADNGNGTFTNPLFYDEFSDPDLIRVGNDYYLTGTTMHTLPGLPILHSKDLVNWNFLTYACPTLNLGPECRLEDGKNMYGQGIWAPSLRYNKGIFYIFSNVNHHNTQVFTATNPAGPWKHTELKCSLHDLSVLFDDDGKIYVIWGYNEIRMARLNTDLTDTIAGMTKVIINKGSGMGEGSHFYKIKGKYYIFSASYDPLLFMSCARADKAAGPYETIVVSANEDFGNAPGWRLKNIDKNGIINLTPPNENNREGYLSMHQGGIVETPLGEWWGFSMMDHNSIGRLTCLSPVTWANGWPYFGLPGNLKRSPLAWIKPNTGTVSLPSAPYERNDDFNKDKLQPVWQWNHVPDNTKWSLTEKRGSLRLHSLPANNFWQARNSLTQRAIGPESAPMVEIDAAGMADGDIAGLALLNLPYGYIGISKSTDGLTIVQFDQYTGKTDSSKISSTHIWLKVHCNFDTEKAEFGFSTDGQHYQSMGNPFTMVFQLTTFQGVRYALFHYNSSGRAGGYADFNNYIVDEPRSRGLTVPIPIGKTITLTSLADSTVLVAWNGYLRPVAVNNLLVKTAAAKFIVTDKGRGRISLRAADGSGYVTVIGNGGMAEVRITKTESAERSLFQWQDMLRGDLMLMSVFTHRYLFANPGNGSLASADQPGTVPNRKDGSCFIWSIADN